MILLLLLAGAFYVLGFWILAVRRPDLALALVFASAPIQNDLSGGGPVKFSIAEINLLLLVPLMLFKRRRFGAWKILAATVGYFLVGLGCTILNWRYTSLVSLVQIAIYLIIAVAMFGSVPKTLDDYRPSLNGFVLASLVIASATIIFRSGYVLGLHKNNAADSLAAGTLIALELHFHSANKRKKGMYLAAVLVLALGLVFTLSRGAWLGTITGTLVIFAFRRQFGLMLRVGVVGSVLFAAAWSFLPQDSKEYAVGFDKDRGNLKPRYESRDFALEQFASSPVTGVGIGLRKEFDATNFVFLTLAETGIVGMAAFLAMESTIAIVMWRGQSRLKRESFAFTLVVLASALAVAKLSHSMVDHYWVRGTLLSSWAALGMGTRAIYEERMQRRKARRVQAALAFYSDAPAQGEIVLSNV